MPLYYYLDLTRQQHVANMSDCSGWVQPFWTYIDAVHNTAATEHTEWIV